MLCQQSLCYWQLRGCSITYWRPETGYWSMEMGMASILTVLCFLIQIGRHQDDHCSISSFMFFMYSGLVSWLSSKQKATALSLIEAKYMAITHAAKELLWIWMFSTIVNLPLPCPFHLLSDNNSAIDMTKSNVILNQAKHINLRYHFMLLRGQCAWTGSLLKTWWLTSSPNHFHISCTLNIHLHWDSQPINKSINPGHYDIFVCLFFFPHCLPSLRGCVGSRTYSLQGWAFHVTFFLI